MLIKPAIGFSRRDLLSWRRRRHSGSIRGELMDGAKVNQSGLSGLSKLTTW